MSALTSLLVRDQRVPVRKIEEAIQRQVIAGGGLDTVLLELNVVPENVLSAYCAVIHGLEPATRAEVLEVPGEVLRLVPAAVADRHRMVPLAFAARTLQVAVASPLDPETEQQLAFLLGVELEQRIVTEATLEQGLAAHYGFQLSPRMRRLTTKLGDRDPGAVPYVAPLEQNTVERPTDDEGYGHRNEETGEERRATEKFAVVAESREVARETAVSITGEEVKTRRVTQEMTSMAPPSRPSRPPVSRPSAAPPEKARAEGPARGRISKAQGELLRKHRGPLTTARAVELLSKADHRDDILEVGFAFTRQFFDFTALFVVQDEEAELLDAAPFDDERLVEARRVVAPLGEPSTFSWIYEGLVPTVSQLERSDVDRAIKQALGRDRNQPSVLAPVMIRKRVVLFLYGDRSGERFSVQDVPELLAFAPKLGEAFQQLILRRKFRGYAQGDARSTDEAPTRTPTDPPPSEARVAEPPASPPRSQPAWQDQQVRSPMKRLEPAEGGRVSKRITQDIAGVMAPPASVSPAPEPRASEPPAAAVEAAPEPAALPESTPESTPEPAVEEVRRGSRPLAAAEAFAPTEPSDEEPARPTEPDAIPPESPAPRAGRAFRPSNVTTAPAEAAETTGPTPLERAVESSLPPRPLRRRRRTKRSAAFEALGVPRSAPPPPGSPPEPDDEDEPEEAPVSGVARTSSTSELPAVPAAASEDPAKDEAGLTEQRADSEAAPLPLSRPKTNPGRGRAPSEELEITIEDADEETAAEVAEAAAHEEITTETPLPKTGPPPEDSTYRGGGQTDVFGAPKRRSRRPPAATPTKDARAEGGRRPLQAEVVSSNRPEAPRGEVAERLTRREVRHADTIPSETPSIIVEMDASVEDAVRSLSQVGPDSAEAEIAQVVALGELALPVLARDFPGLLWFDRSRPHRRLPRGRDVSALARAIAAFGDRAVPYLVPILDHPGADERFYAVLLASEFRHPLLVEPLAKRVFDTDERTAALAVDVLRMQRRFEQPLRDVIEGLRAEARVPRSDVRRRVAATRALGALRDAGALDLFVQLLSSDKPELVAEAHRSLVSLTKQDFGDVPARWLDWVDDNRSRHRIEWLIEGLLHADEKMRSAAGDELKKITQEYYGYHPSLPRRDREVAQRKYLDWWRAEGRRRFLER